MSSDEERSLVEMAEDLRSARHAKLRTALPFPELDWNDESAVSTSLAKLHDFVESLANGAIDWYLEKKTIKKRTAVWLHWWTYVFGVLAAIIPLVMLYIGTFVDPDFMSRNFGLTVKLNSIAAETALLLIGVAGGATLIDRSAGYTGDWMRYMTTASLINQALIKFEFAWNELEWTSPYPPAPGKTDNAGAETGTSQVPVRTTTNPSSQNPGNNLPADPVAQRIKLARDFCFETLDVVGKETSVWTDELKQRVAQMASQFPPQHRP